MPYIIPLSKGQAYIGLVSGLYRAYIGLIYLGELNQTPRSSKGKNKEKNIADGLINGKEEAFFLLPLLVA